MNDCAGYREWISRLQDRRLDAPERDRLSDHLAACPGCRRVVEETEAGDAMLRRVEPEDLPPGFDDKVMARLEKKPARGITGSQISLVAIAASLLVAVGAYLAHRRHEENRIAGEIQAHLGVVKPFMNSISKLPESSDLEWPRLEAAALGIDHRIEALKHLSQGPEVVRYVQQARNVLTTLKSGDAPRIRIAAQHPDLQAPILVKTLSDRAIELTFPRETSQGARDLVIGHVSLSRGNYGLAVEKLSAALKSDDAAPNARFWLAEAHQYRGEVSKALGAYAGCLRVEKTRRMALRAIKSLGTTHELYVNRTPAAKFDVETFNGAFNDVTLLYRPMNTMTWTLIGSPETDCIKAFGKLEENPTWFTYTAADGIGTVEFQPAQLQASSEWGKLKTHEPMQVILETAPPKSR